MNTGNTERVRVSTRVVLGREITITISMASWQADLLTCLPVIRDKTQMHGCTYYVYNSVFDHETSIFVWLEHHYSTTVN